MDTGRLRQPARSRRNPLKGFGFGRVATLISLQGRGMQIVVKLVGAIRFCQLGTGVGGLGIPAR